MTSVEWRIVREQKQKWPVALPGLKGIGQSVQVCSTFRGSKGSRRDGVSGCSYGCKPMNPKVATVTLTS